MKTNAFRKIGLIVGVAAGLTASAVRGGNEPVWTATIPDSSVPGTTSQLATVTSYAAGSTLAIIPHYTGGAGAGTQLVLIGAHGQILATGEFAPFMMTNVPVTPISVTPRKVIVLVNTFGTVSMHQGVVDASRNLVFTLLPLSSVTEQWVTPTGHSDFDRKTLFSTTSVSNKVVEIRRYTIAKMRP
jgi:hypothetical protein